MNFFVISYIPIFLSHLLFLLLLQFLTPFIYLFRLLSQNCISVSGVRGKEYKPKFLRLILYLKNIELCPIDSYGSSEVIELLLQVKKFFFFFFRNKGLKKHQNQYRIAFYNLLFFNKKKWNECIFIFTVSKSINVILTVSLFLI